MISIVKLDSLNIARASELADDVFSYSKALPGEAFQASLDHEKLAHYNGKYDENVVFLEYFLAMEGDRVLGTIGYYETEWDKEIACWVGWFCVGPGHRGRGIGKLLMDYLVDLARKRNKKFIRLYTSTHVAEKAAQTFYEHRGFAVWNEKEIVHETGFDIFYRQLILDDNR